MRVLVTDATGFVGSALVPALVAAGHDVVALVREPLVAAIVGHVVAVTALSGAAAVRLS